MSTNCFKEYSVRDLSSICQESGISSLEIWDDDGYFVETGTPHQELAHMLADRGLTVCSVHAPFSNWSEEAQKAFFDRFKQSCEKACTFGATYIVVHPMTFHSERRDDRLRIARSMPRALKVWRHLAEIALGFELELAFENLAPGAQWPSGCSLALVTEIVDAVQMKNVGICVDFSHCFALGDNVADSLRRNCPSHIIGVHASDGFYADLADQHLPPGEGELDWVDAFRALQEMGFTGNINLEAKGLMAESKELRTVLNFMVDAWKSSRSAG